MWNSNGWRPVEEAQNWRGYIQEACEAPAPHQSEMPTAEGSVRVEAERRKQNKAGKAPGVGSSLLYQEMQKVSLAGRTAKDLGKSKSPERRQKPIGFKHNDPAPRGSASPQP